MKGKIRSATKCRKKISKDVIEHAKYMEEPVGLIIGGYYNQDIVSIEVSHFFCKITMARGASNL